jgi:hypothetical protein
MQLCCAGDDPEIRDTSKHRNVGHLQKKHSKLIQAESDLLF